MQNDLARAYQRLAQPEPEPEPVAWEALVESVRQMRDVQGMDGNWNYDPYMQGLFNGLEFAVSLLEVREPRFRDAPEKWLCDQPKARIFSQGENDD
jgi:hypothetical protein